MIRLGVGPVPIARRGTEALSPWLAAAMLLVTAVGITAACETFVPSITGIFYPYLDIVRIAVALYVVVRVAVPVANRFWPLPWRRPAVAIWLAVLGSIVAGLVGGVAWPNSGDEYSYLSLADLLLTGRLWAPAPPHLALFATFHVLARDGRVFSPYPPGWSAYLAVFRGVNLVWLANPVMAGALGIALVGACRRLEVGPRITMPALVLVLLTPFTLFMSGSLFPQTCAAALTAGIVWAQLADEAAPRIWRKLLIGALFGALLTVRYEVFAIVSVTYAIDRLAMRRFRVIADGMIVLAGVLPFVALLAAYNAAITGNPLQSTILWGTEPAPTDDYLVLGGHLAAAAYHNLFWAGNLAEFGGLPVAFLAAIGLAVKLRRRTCRFYDFLFPAALVFYSFLPFSGGQQYGPRYWFWAWPIAVLTIVTALVDSRGGLRLRSRRFAFEGFTAASLIYSVGAFCVLLVTTRAYIDARREVFNAVPRELPAIVLLPDREIRLWPWQPFLIPAGNLDFARNDMNWSRPVLYGRANIPGAEPEACGMPGRTVYQWEEPGRLVRVACR